MSAQNGLLTTPSLSVLTGENTELWKETAKTVEGRYALARVWIYASTEERRRMSSSFQREMEELEQLYTAQSFKEDYEDSWWGDADEDLLWKLIGLSRKRVAMPHGESAPAA